MDVGVVAASSFFSPNMKPDSAGFPNSDAPLPDDGSLGCCRSNVKPPVIGWGGGVLVGFPNIEPGDGSKAVALAGAPKVKPDGFLASAAAVAAAVAVVVTASVDAPKPVDVEEAEGPNDGLAKGNEFEAGFGSGAGTVADCPKEKPVVAGLGSSLGVVGAGAAAAAGAPPKVNGVDAPTLPPNIPPGAGAEGAAAEFELPPKVNAVEDAGLSLLAVGPNRPKAGAGVVLAVAVVVVVVVFPNRPLVGAEFALPNDAEFAFPNNPVVPLVGAGDGGAKVEKGLGLGCSCWGCPNGKPLLKVVVWAGGVGVPPPNPKDGVGEVPPFGPPNPPVGMDAKRLGRALPEFAARAAAPLEPRDFFSGAILHLLADDDVARRL